jgi:hypothetical protein
MMLGKYFSLEEMTKSQTAMRRGIDNIPSDQELENLVELVKNVLDPIREHFKKPVTVNSGYRGKKLNKAIKGSKNSQHCKGQAADIEIIGISNYDLACWIRDNMDFDQLILEFHNRKVPDSGWVHVSWNSPKKNRKQTLTIDSNGTKQGF